MSAFFMGVGITILSAALFWPNLGPRYLIFLHALVITLISLAYLIKEIIS